MLVCIHTLASLKGRGRVETEERVGKVLQHPLCSLEALTAVSGGGGGVGVAEWSMRLTQRAARCQWLGCRLAPRECSSSSSMGNRA
ncbi:unnamed protein product [Hydatigera taeniaeformis]|uniref:Uncharacterized protein n=1 Tax=Hydatigena taeniaeformis TaxID=6205 RepID=A0A0R3WVT6_HYDTA|nr:unnamed protein product [Hydatigera taeniaeformis]